MKLCIRTAAVTLMLLTGCGEVSDPPATAPTTAAEPEETVTPSEETPDEPGSATPESPGETAQPRTAEGQALRDLARRLGVPESEITVVSVEQVTWRDRSLGCPQPGMMYAQVLTDGVRVVLEADGDRYRYHAGAGRTAFLCQNPEPPARR